MIFHHFGNKSSKSCCSKTLIYDDYQNPLYLENIIYAFEVFLERLGREEASERMSNHEGVKDGLLLHSGADVNI